MHYIRGFTSPQFYVPYNNVLHVRTHNATLNLHNKAICIQHYINHRVTSTCRNGLRNINYSCTATCDFPYSIIFCCFVSSIRDLDSLPLSLSSVSRSVLSWSSESFCGAIFV